MLVNGTASSEAEVDEVWARWWSGQAVRMLSREMRRQPTTVRDLLKRCGSGDRETSVSSAPSDSEQDVLNSILGVAEEHRRFAVEERRTARSALP